MKIYEALEVLLTNARNPSNIDEATRKRLIEELRQERGDFAPLIGESPAEGFGFTGQFAAGDIAVTFEHGHLMSAVELAEADIPDDDGSGQVEDDRLPAGFVKAADGLLRSDD